MKKVFCLTWLLVLLVLILAACAKKATPAVAPGATTGSAATTAATATSAPAATATTAPRAARTLNVSVGAGQDTSQVLVFLPATVSIRVGDTVIWKIKGDEIHSATFMDDVLFPPFAVPVPGGGPTDLMFNPKIAFPTRPPGGPVETYSGTGYVNSGAFSKESPAPGIPANDTFSLTFNKPGIYAYFCMIHLSNMRGTVIVESATATGLPSQADIDKQAKAEEDALLGIIKAARQQAKDALKEPGPGGTTVWTVHAGALDITTGDERAQPFEFMPKDLTVKAGDTVFWTSPYFHTATFDPSPTAAEFIVPKPQPQGLPVLSLNPRVLFAVKPVTTFDPAKYFNSSALGPFTPVTFFSLTFDKPGKYDYFCAVHRELGMKGTINVQPKSP